MPRTRKLPALLLLAGLGMSAAARAENRIVMGSRSGDPGSSGITVDVSIQNDQPIHAFSVALTFDPSVMTLEGMSYQGTALEPLAPGFFAPSIDNDTGTAMLGVILSYDEEDFSRVELAPSPLEPQRVAVLSFNLREAAPPGSYPLSLQNGLGSPPISNVFSLEGRTIHPSLAPGTLTVNNLYVFKLEEVRARPGALFETRIFGRHPRRLQGFQVAVLFPKAVLTFISATYQGTAAQAGVAPNTIEFFDSQVNEVFTGEFSRLELGAVVDALTPLTGHEIPASPDSFQSLARFIFDSQDDPGLIGTSVALTLHNINTPPFLDNIFIVGEESITPDLLHGKVTFVDAPTFRRGRINPDNRLDVSDAIFLLLHLFQGGDAPECQLTADVNDDNRADVSDVIFLLSFLFTGGQRPRPPIDTCGPDPTPGGNLTCNSFPACQG